MPRKGMRTIFFKNSSPSASPSRSIPPPSPCHTFSDSVMEENIEIAHSLITKWDSDSSNSFASINSLFNNDNRQEAKQYLSVVKDLQSAMHYFVAEDSSSEKLVRAQNLMQIAMKRLEKEFYQILSSNRDHLEPESVSNRSSTTRSSVSDFDDECSEDEFRVADDSISETERVSMIAMADLKAIADCMISSGYGKECVKIYKIIRKSVVDEGLYHLGVERLSFSHIQKMDWDVLELKIRNWLNALKVAVRTLFYGERILCDHVFSNSETIRESCFAEIAREGAMYLFEFPEFVAKCKKTPEKMFRKLDLYESISDLWPEIESIFSFEATTSVRSQAVTSQVKLGEAVRTMLVDFESAIRKDTSKTPVPGGGIHPLTRYVMNYISFLADYSGVLSDIVADWPLSYSFSVTGILLRRSFTRDVALSYLFLANNLHYVVNKVRTSNIKFLIGEDWVTQHESKVKQYTSNYERMGWTKVLSSLPENPSAEMSPDLAKDFFRRFNATFEEACKKQASWVVTDPKLRDEIKISVARKLIPTYQEFYENNRVGFRRVMGSGSSSQICPQ
ncbi:Exocyst subunit Exo70 family protein [Quillaja saponaria]|uniref:Exocyst subunit Exo70 family protein n=1 Tax=Quillaja saponaria TaxID=32244 RepID=A0AAD7KXP8_QUISA|nr:Exocyst subunit Exo70 family protein [Quillaja saponaria]